MGESAGRILAVDYGSKKVGLALSDPMRIIATGAGTIDHDAGLVERIAQTAADEQVALILVGMPYAPDGGEGGKAAEVRRFIVALQAKVHVPIETWDESYSSEKAKQAFRDAGMKKKQRRDKRLVDEMAARILLQEYLEESAHR